MHPDNARELKGRILRLLGSTPVAERAGEGPRRLWIAVGLAPAERGRVRVAVRLEREADRDVLPTLSDAAHSELDVRVIGRVHALATPATDWSPAALQQRVRPLRPGLSVAHSTGTAGSLGGFVRTADGLAILSNNHVLAASSAAAVGDVVLQPGPADRGNPVDRVAALGAFVPLATGTPNSVAAAVATLDAGVGAEPGAFPGG